MIIKTKFIWPGFKAWTLGPFILVHPDEKNNESLIAHETTHVSQWRAHGFKFFKRYLFSSFWRANYEAEAYANQILASKNKKDLKEKYAINLSRKYMLGISINEARILIERYLNVETTF